MEEDMRNIKEFRVAYDRDSDVLYIHASRQPGESGVEDEFGVIWQYSFDGEPIGCIVQDFSEYWYPQRRGRLTTSISEHFELPENQVEKILEHAASD
jgi:hypothetical protein